MIGVLISPGISWNEVRVIMAGIDVNTTIVMVDHETAEAITMKQSKNIVIPIHSYDMGDFCFIPEETHVFNPKPITGRIQLIRHGRHWIHEHLDRLNPK